jgi:hypothetical protein
MGAAPVDVLLLLLPCTLLLPFVAPLEPLPPMPSPGQRYKATA